MLLWLILRVVGIMGAGPCEGTETRRDRLRQEECRARIEQGEHDPPPRVCVLAVAGEVAGRPLIFARRDLWVIVCTISPDVTVGTLRPLSVFGNVPHQE